MSNLAYIPSADNTVPTIAANIRAEIARAGMTDAQFAARFGMTAMAVSRRLSGGTPFTTSEVARAASFFGVSIESLFTEHPRPSASAVRSIDTTRNSGKLRNDNLHHPVVSLANWARRSA